MNEHSLIFPKLAQVSLSSSLITNNHFFHTNTAFTLKPQKYIIQRDIPPDIIYQVMIDEYVKLPHIKMNSEINEALLLQRCQIISKMKEFIVNYRLSSQIIYNAIFYLDMLICAQSPTKIDKLGVGALILAIKFNDLEIKNPRIKRFQYFHDNYSFTMGELLQIELICLKSLNYILNYIQPLNFLQVIVLNGIVFNIDKKGLVNGEINSNIYTLPFHILEIAMETIKYIEYHPLYVACACVAVSRETYHLDKWNALLENLCKIKFSSFESIYLFVKSTYNNKMTQLVKPKSSNKKNGNKKNNIRYESFSANSQSEKNIKSSLAKIKSKSIEKIKKTSADHGSRSLKIKNKSTSKSIKECNSSFFNVPEFNPSKNRNLRSNYCNVISREINRSCALHLSKTKEDIRYMNMSHFQSIRKEYSTEKKKNKLTNSKVLQKGFNSTLNVFSNIIKLNNNFNNNPRNKGMRNIRRIDGQNSKKGNKTKSVSKPSFNFYDYNGRIVKNSSFCSLKNKSPDI